MDKTNDIPEHVSWMIVDAWLAIPPCKNSVHPYCHVQCPYHYECYPDYYDNENDDEL